MAHIMYIILFSVMYKVVILQDVSILGQRRGLLTPKTKREWVFERYVFDLLYAEFQSVLIGKAHDLKKLILLEAILRAGLVSTVGTRGLQS